ncbi:MAG: AzlD domain-containing protein [Chloroflexi bacterium]|nr:AzlD domain-containing protein [Chloroflexota bacterium]
MSVTGLILMLALATFLLRLLPLVALSRVRLPAWAEEWLRLVPGAVLAASLAPSLLVREGAPFIAWHNPYVWAALPAFLVAWRTRNMVWTMLTGMAAFALLGRVLP